MYGCICRFIEDRVQHSAVIVDTKIVYIQYVFGPANVHRSGQPTLKNDQQIRDVAYCTASVTKTVISWNVFVTRPDSKPSWHPLLFPRVSLSAVTWDRTSRGPGGLYQQRQPFPVFPVRLKHTCSELPHLQQLIPAISISKLLNVECLNWYLNLSSVVKQPQLLLSESVSEALQPTWLLAR